MMIRGDRRQQKRSTKDRREHPRTPGKLKYILDVTFEALRKLEQDREKVKRGL